MYESLIAQLKQLKGRHCITIEGNCGSGKTQLSYILQKQLNCNLIHIDHYYLPFIQRKDNWKDIPGGNMDFDRLKKEVLIPFSNKQEICSTRFNQFEQKLAETTVQTDCPVLILEGSYSSHPDILSYSDIHIFLTCDHDTQIKRLMNREKDNFKGFQEIWIQKEIDYYNQCHIQENADYIIDTTDLF